MAHRQSNSDYSSTSPYGICVSCHATAKAKQGMGTDQLNVGGANTPVIGGAQFNTSAHNYNVASTFGASTFNANCSKCHSDEQTKTYQGSTYKFGTHYSAASAILGALGVSLADAYTEEDECYACHSVSSAGLKAFADKDWYNQSSMDATAQSIHGRFVGTPATAQTPSNMLYFRATGETDAGRADAQRAPDRRHVRRRHVDRPHHGAGCSRGRLRDQDAGPWHHHGHLEDGDLHLAAGRDRHDHQCGQLDDQHLRQGVQLRRQRLRALHASTSGTPPTPSAP